MNQKNKYNSKKIGFIIAGAMTVMSMVCIITGFIFNSKTIEKNSEKHDKQTEISKNEIVKIVDTEFDVYLLKKDGTVYVIENEPTFEIKQFATGVKDITGTEDGLYMSTLDGKSYIDNGYWIYEEDTMNIIEEKNLSLSSGYAPLLELENIKKVVDYGMYDSYNEERPVLFLTTDGVVYKQKINGATSSKQRYEKVAENIKDIIGNYHNTILITNENTAYAFGYYLDKNGITETLDYAFLGEESVLSYEQKYKVGENLKKVKLYSSGQYLEIYSIDQNNKLSMIRNGLGYYHNGQFYETIKTPMVISEDVDDVYTNIGNIYIKKTDGSLWYKNYISSSSEFAKIIDKNVKDVYLTNKSEDGALILMNNNDLYVHGNNNPEKFGTEENIKKYDKPTKIRENIEKVYLIQNHDGSAVFFATTDNEVYYTGNLYETQKLTKLEI